MYTATINKKKIVCETLPEFVKMVAIYAPLAMHTNIIKASLKAREKALTKKPKTKKYSHDL